jgi:glycerol uptake operon antiterminator
MSSYKLTDKRIKDSKRLREKLSERVVIAGIRKPEDATIALEKKVVIIFILFGDIFDLIKVKEKTKDSDVLLFPHLELIKGIGKDRAGMKFLKQEIGIDGILTTHSRLIRSAKQEGLFTIQCLFILDSEGLRTGVSVVKECSPEAIEILPAMILPRLIKDLPIESLAGGLIRTEEEIKEVLSSGAIAISTSRKELWGFKGFSA